MKINTEKEPKFISFFKRLFGTGLTGRVVEETASEKKGKEEKLIEAVVSANQPFTHALEQGETAEIAQGSVRINGKKIDESALNLHISNSQLTITTSYSE